MLDLQAMIDNSPERTAHPLVRRWVLVGNGPNARRVPNEIPQVAQRLYEGSADRTSLSWGEVRAHDPRLYSCFMEQARLLLSGRRWQETAK